jgi:DnaK suppressor protein
MNPALPIHDLRLLQTRLEHRRAELRVEIDTAAAAEHARAAARTAGVHDGKDDAGEQATDTVIAAETERDLAELQRVDAALHRIADGTYGRCTDCREPIPTRRLRAQPSAARCARCQAAAERLAKR